jgi:hypothetical protein
MFKNPFRSNPPAPIAGPYAQSQVNFIYQLLFCDQPALFQPQPGIAQTPWQQILLSDRPDAAAIRRLAQDPTQESRCRILAYNWLRLNHLEVPKAELFAVLIEVPLERGLDVLATYADSSIRYINQTGNLTIFESAPSNLAAQANKVLAAGRMAITQIGPWDRPRLPAPSQGKIRLTFLVSDGLYFGEGPFPGMERDPIAAPVIHESGVLLNMVVETALAGKK